MGKRLLSVELRRWTPFDAAILVEKRFVSDPGDFCEIYKIGPNLGMSEIASPTSNTTETGNNDRENNHETEAVNRDIKASNNFVNEDDDLGITAETAAAIDSIVSRIDVVEELQDDVDLGLDVIGDGDISDHQDQDVLEQVLEAPTVHEDQPSETVESM